MNTVSFDFLKTRVWREMERINPMISQYKSYFQKKWDKLGDKATLEQNFQNLFRGNENHHPEKWKLWLIYYKWWFEELVHYNGDYKKNYKLMHNRQMISKEKNQECQISVSEDSVISITDTIDINDDVIWKEDPNEKARKDKGHKWARVNEIMRNDPKYIMILQFLPQFLRDEFSFQWLKKVIDKPVHDELAKIRLNRQFNENISWIIYDNINYRIELVFIKGSNHISVKKVIQLS